MRTARERCSHPEENISSICLRDPIPIRRRGAQYVDERSMASVSAGGYVIAADMPLAAAADKLVSSEHSRAVKLSKRAATEKWKLVRANADHLIKNVSRCDSFASRVIDWIEENVQ